MKYFVTGGAGFIGSNLVDYLLDKGNEVIVFDDLSTGRELFLEQNKDNPKFKLVVGDLKNQQQILDAIGTSEFVFHLAAHADVRSGFEDHDIDHVGNLETTKNLLEVMYKKGIKKFAFASTSSVYGDATIHPTPENYPFEPTSLYGATKSACESYINAYASYYDWDVYIFRFVSFIGERYTHGIIFDLLKKIKANNKEIELFSDGTPRKSSIYVGDGISAIDTVINNSKDKVNIYNIGHDQILTVDQIVDVIVTEAGYPDIKKNWLGKGSNWKGDNEFVHLSNQKLKKLGWEPKVSIEEGIKKTVQYLLKNHQLIN